jgi:hypothetical protein
VNPAEDGVAVPEPEPMIYRPIFWAGTHGIGEPPRYGGWGGVQADATPYGLRLAVAGRSYETGIGVLANSRIEVRNAGFRPLRGHGRGRRFRTRPQPSGDLPGLWGWQAARAVAADARLARRPRALTAPVAGVRLIEIVARSAGPRGQGFPVGLG